MTYCLLIVWVNKLHNMSVYSFGGDAIKVFVKDWTSLLTCLSACFEKPVDWFTSTTTSWDMSSLIFLQITCL
jgi:hypothetical protein